MSETYCTFKKNGSFDTNNYENPYLKYTIYGRFGTNVCGRRCKTLVSNVLLQKCVCKNK